MFTIARGDLVYIPFPNQEGPGFTVRLCIVLDNSCRMVDLVPCTKSTHQDWRYDKCFIIKKDSPEGLAMKLAHDSLIIVDRNESFPERLVQSKHRGGVTPESILKKIEDMMDEL